VQALPSVKKKKESFHSLNEYTRMLNAAEFLMREHIKTTKELNTTAEEKLREKQQMEVMQRRQQEFMLQQLEPAKMEAAELAKMHHQQLLGLRVGPTPGFLLPLHYHHHCFLLHHRLCLDLPYRVV